MNLGADDRKSADGDHGQRSRDPGQALVGPRADTQHIDKKVTTINGQAKTILGDADTILPDFNGILANVGVPNGGNTVTGHAN